MHKSGSVQDKTFDGLSTRDQFSTASEVVSNSSNENLRNIDNLGHILECASMTSTEFLQIEKDRKEKIQNGKISYNIARAKEPISVLPLLYQKDIQEEIFPMKNYTQPTKANICRMSASMPKRQNPAYKKQKLPKIAQPILVKELPKKII